MIYVCFVRFTLLLLLSDLFIFLDFICYVPLFILFRPTSLPVCVYVYLSVFWIVHDYVKRWRCLCSFFRIPFHRCHPQFGTFYILLSVIHLIHAANPIAPSLSLSFPLCVYFETLAFFEIFNEFVSFFFCSAFHCRFVTACSTRNTYCNILQSVEIALFITLRERKVAECGKYVVPVETWQIA